MPPGASIALLLLSSSAAAAAAASTTGVPQMIDKAAPDECRASNSDGSCRDQRVNDAYVFGLTWPSKAAGNGADNLWLGTGANNICTIFGGAIYSQSALSAAMEDIPMRMTTISNNNAWQCEFGHSKFAQTFRAPPEAALENNRLPPPLGDWRPARVYTVDRATAKMTDRTPKSDPLLNATLGMRSAGSFGDIVIMGGPTLGTGFSGRPGGCVLFAYRASTGEYLGSKVMPEWNNIRRWVAWNPTDGRPGALFTTVNALKSPVGRVLRWAGNFTSPFEFVEVGQLSEGGAYIALHKDRLFVTTWPDQSGTQEGGLWMSPPLRGVNGLDTADVTEWRKIWTSSDYEPDKPIASTYFAGALASFGDYVYFGTLNFPGSSARAHQARPQGLLDRGGGSAADRGVIMLRAAAPPTQPPGAVAAAVGPAVKVELLYGEKTLGAWNGATWAQVPTKMNAPLFGSTGFGNRYNTYIWSMEVFDSQLFVGTCDWSTLARETTAGVVGRGEKLGADVWRFPSTEQAAEAFTLDGFGNPMNFGVRNMIATPDTIYFGTASASNKVTAKGGWELWSLRSSSADGFNKSATGGNAKAAAVA